MPSTSVPQAHQHPHHYEHHPEDSDMVSEDLPQSTSHVKSQLAAALAARGNSDISMCLTSRKRKQSSPQPCRELMAAMAEEQSGTEEATGPGPSKLMKPTSQLETKNSKTTFYFEKSWRNILNILNHLAGSKLSKIKNNKLYTNKTKKNHTIAKF